MPINYAEYAARKERVTNCLKKLSNLLRSIKLQKDVKQSFEKFGLSKATWMVIRHIPEAKVMFTEEPSLECLNAIGTANVSLKEHTSSTSDVVADWLYNSEDSASDFTETAKYHLAGLFKVIADLTDEVDEAEDLDESKEITDLPCARRRNQVDNLRSAYDAFTGLDAEGQGVDLTKAKDSLANVYGDDLSSACLAESLSTDTLENLGYDLESTVDLADALLDMIEDSITLIDDKGEFIATRMRSQAKSLKEGTNSTPDTDVPLDEAEVSQEDGEMDSISLTADIAMLYVAYLNAVGHISLKFLDTITEIAKATD